MKEQTKLARMRFIELTGITPICFHSQTGSMKKYYAIEVKTTDMVGKCNTVATNSILPDKFISGIKIIFVNNFRDTTRMDIDRQHLDNPTPTIKD